MENNFCGFIHNMLEITTGILGFVHHQGLQHLFTGPAVVDILQANSIIINLSLQGITLSSSGMTHPVMTHPVMT